MITVGTDCNGCINNVYIDWATHTCPEKGTEYCKQQQEQKRQRRIDRNRKPEPLPEPAAYYDRQSSRYPDRIRLSFADGHTEIYDRRVNQPKPNTYVNSQMRRRRKP